MRIAVISDIHGNLPALDAVLEDLNEVRPDVVVQGGDVALGGPNPVEVVDRIRELGWPSVVGNTDAVLAGEEAIAKLSRRSVADAARRTIEMIGPERVDWLTSRPMSWIDEDLAVMHATPGDCSTVVAHDAPDDEPVRVYSTCGTPVVVYGHIHHPYVRTLANLIVVNSGSVSLPLNRDPRATYAVVEDGTASHRYVPYDVERVAEDMKRIDYPNADGYSSWLRSGAFG